nr:hypothetical protein [Methanothrix sp.]
MVRNPAITGKRKLPKKNVFVDVQPEVIDLKEGLANLGITHKQLVEIGIMCGTDYNAGLERVGPKTALKLIRRGRFGEHPPWKGRESMAELGRSGNSSSRPGHRQYEIA